MKIIIQRKEKKNIRLRIPNGMVFNRLTICFALKYLRKSGSKVTRQRTKKLLKELKRCCGYPGWILAEVERPDGDYIKVTL